MSPTYTLGDAMDLAEGQYAAIIDSIEVQKPQPGARFDKDQLVITWKLTEVEREDGSDITRRQYVNDVGALTPRSNLYKIFSAVLNDAKPLEKDVNYDTDQLIGKPGLIFWGSYVGEDGTTKQKILTVSPPKKQTAGAGTIRRKVADDEQIDTDKALDDI